MRAAWSGSELRGEPVKRSDVAADDLEHVRAEAQRVLERVEAFEHGQRRVAAGPPEARLSATHLARRR